MKHLTTVLILILFSSIVSCQNEKTTKTEDIAERVVIKACNDSLGKNASITEYLEFSKKLIQTDKLISDDYEKEIKLNKQVSRIEEKFDAYIKFLLRRDCNEYRKAYDEKDKTFEGKLLLRAAYLNNRNLLFDLFDNEDINKLTKYFDVEDNEQLQKDLKQFIKGFNKAKKKTFVYTTNQNREEIIFYNNFLNYMSGEEKLKIIFVFDIAGEKITKYSFSYGEIKIIKE